MAAEDDPERFVRLETKIAYQERTISDLNEVVVSLNQLVSDFQRRLAVLERWVRAELEPRDMPNEKPPHY
jgi:uncharacterized coiled-coil protein SlyX